MNQIKMIDRVQQKIHTIKIQHTKTKTKHVHRLMKNTIQEVVIKIMYLKADRTSNYNTSYHIYKYLWTHFHDQMHITQHLIKQSHDYTPYMYIKYNTKIQYKPRQKDIHYHIKQHSLGKNYTINRSINYSVSQ